MKVEILDERRVYDGFFKLEEVTLRHERFNGEMSKVIKRLTFERGDAVAVLIFNIEKEELIFTNQFRLPAHRKGEGWMTEIVAGMIDANESPEQAAIREVEEEIGYRVKMLRYIGTFFTSPGGSSERIILYYAEVRDMTRVSRGGGVIVENEDIQLVSVSFKSAWKDMQEGRICDAKTIVALQWLKLHLPSMRRRHRRNENIGK